MQTCVRTTGKHTCFSVKAGAFLTLCSCSHQSTTTKQVLTYKKHIVNAYIDSCNYIQKLNLLESQLFDTHVYFGLYLKLYKWLLSFLCSDAAKITEHAELVNGKLRSCALCLICSWTVTYICIAKSMHIDTQLGVVSRLPQHHSIYSLYTVYMQPSNHKWTELAIPCALQKFRSLARSKDKLKAWPFGPKRRPPLLDTVHKDPVQTHLSFPFVVECSSCL